MYYSFQYFTKLLAKHVMHVSPFICAGWRMNGVWIKIHISK